MNVIYIPINEEGLDDLFIYKHKIEKNEKCEKHIPYTKFINEYVFGDRMLTYYDSKTSTAIPFSIWDIDNEKIIFYTVASDEALNKMKSLLSELNYSFNSLHKMTQYDSTQVNNPYLLSFFVTSDNIMLVDKKQLEEITTRKLSDT